MNNFDIIEYGYNRNDETINFGTRCLADGDNLYETCTLATLKSSNDNNDQSAPFINAIVNNGKIYFSTNRCMRVFDQKECSDIVFNNTFDDIIDTFSISDDGNFLLVCLRNGSFQVVSFGNTQPEYIHNGSLFENQLGERFYISSFLEITDENHVKFIIVSRKGKADRICINHRQIGEENYVTTEEICDVRTSVKVAAFSYPLLLMNGTELTLFDVESEELESDKGYELEKLFCLGHMFCGLQSNGELIKFCSLTLISFPLITGSVYKDVIMVLNENQNPAFLVAVTSKDESETSYVQALTYPDFAEIYSIKLSDDITLVLPESVNDETLYISKIRKEDKVTEIRFHMIYESVPQKRLARLLRKHKFEEAEAFAKMFNIDPVVINKARAQEIEEKIACTSEDVERLLKILSVVDDDEFKLTCCINVHCSCAEYDDVKKVLNYGCKIVPSKKTHDLKEVIYDLQSTLSQFMFRFDIFSAIYGKENYSMATWTHFSTACLLEELETQIKSYKIDEAIFIFSHLDEFAINKLNSNKIEYILAILNQLPMNVYQAFLPTFIPVTLSYIPHVLPVFIEWLHNKIFRLEKREASRFPDNGIEFAENIIKLLKVNTYSYMSFQRECCLNKNCLDQLEKLILALKGIQTLKSNFRITMPLSKYLMGPRTIIRFLLNVNLNLEECDILLKEFLCPLMFENHLHPDEVLLEEIDNLMHFKETYWVNTIGAILNHINSVKTKLEAVKMILRYAQVPWCDAIRSLAMDALRYTHPMVVSIKEMIEDEPMLIVLWKPKYKIKDKRIGDLNDFMFTVNRIMYCNDENMVHDVYKLCRTKEHRHEANLMLFRHFVKHCNYEKAFELLDNNEPEEILKCVEEIASYAEIRINNESNIPHLDHYYHAILGSLHKRWIDHTSSAFKKTLINDHINLLRSVYNLKTVFGKDITSHQLRRKDFRAGLLNELIDELVAELEVSKCDILNVLSRCSKLSQCLNVERDEILIRLCEKLSNYSLTFKVAEHLYATSTDTKNLCQIAVNMLKYTGCLKLKCQEDGSLLSDSSFDSQTFGLESTEDESENFVDGLKLAEKIASKSVLHASPEDRAACMEVVDWVNCGFFLTRTQQSPLQNIIYKNLFTGISTLPGFIAFSSLRNVFMLYYNFIGNFNSSDHKYLTEFGDTKLSEEDFVRELKLLPKTIEDLCREGQHFTAYKLVITMQRGFLTINRFSPDILKLLNNILRSCCLPPLLRAVVSSTYIDTTLLYDLLLCCEQTEAVKFVLQNLRLYKRQPKKFASIAQTGVRLTEIYRITEGKQVWVNSLLSVKWWQKLQLDQTKKMTYDSFFMTKPDERIEQLISLGSVTVDDIKAYCFDFCLKGQLYYVILLKKTLLNWRPEYSVETDIYGKKQLHLKSNESCLLNISKDIMDAIEDKEMVFEALSSMWNVVNFYHYEVFICILNILSLTKPKKMESRNLPMLQLLKNYQRVSKPSQEEIEHWFTTFPTTQTLDPFSEFRLPFIPVLFTNDVWKIIRPEITLQTYTFWFEAITILKYLNKDDICSYVVKGIVSSGTLQVIDANEWAVHPKHEDLFAEIDECLKHMTSLELATSVAYHLMTHTPRGADQVNAAAMCYKYALKYKESVPLTPGVDKAFVKVENRFFSFSALHILHTYQLAEEKYFHLVAQPKELVIALYEDERIIRKAESVDFLCPDINKAADALAKLFVSVDIQKIKHELLNNWLADSSVGSLDMTTTSNLMNTNMDIRNGNVQLSEDNLKRAAYLCIGEDLHHWQAYLFKSGFDDSDEHKTLHYRARALKCFCAISDVDTITKYADISFEEFRNFIDKLSLVSDLEYVGFTMDTDSLDQFNKKELLNRLGHQGSNTVNIKIMAKICITYSIYEAKYWEFIINCAVKLNMITELKIYVNVLRNKNFKYKAFYINAWQKIIDHAFHAASSDSSEDLHETLLNIILLIQSCPVLSSLKFENGLSRCLQLEKPTFAAVLLQYLPVERRNLYIKDITEKCNADIYKNLDILATQGVWGIPKVQSTLKRCLDN